MSEVIVVASISLIFGVILGAIFTISILSDETK